MDRGNKEKRSKTKKMQDGVKRCWIEKEDRNDRRGKNGAVRGKWKREQMDKRQEREGEEMLEMSREIRWGKRRRRRSKKKEGSGVKTRVRRAIKQKGICRRAKNAVRTRKGECRDGDVMEVVDRVEKGTRERTTKGKGKKKKKR